MTEDATMQQNRMAVLITSCDAYEDVWDIFFSLMDKYWAEPGGIPYNVYLNSETKEYNKKFQNFQVQSLNLRGKLTKKKNVTWSERMLDVLERIDEEYVFILVEDFFLRERVQTELIEELLDRMDADQSIGQIQLFGTRLNCDNERINQISSEIKMEQIGDNKAKVVFVPVIWRKSVLKKWMRAHESIWNFEACGAKRAKRWHYKEKVFRVEAPAIFNYLWEKGCYCVVNGKWMRHPLLDELFEKNNISVDYEKRGTITMEQWQAVDLKTIMKRYTLSQIIVKVFNRMRSFF